MKVKGPPYYITGSYKFFIDRPIREKAENQNRHIFYSESCARSTHRMLEFSEWFNKLAETGGKLFQEAANFWLLRYHYMKNDLDVFLNDKPPFKTLISPDLTGTYRGITLQFAGVKGWNFYEPVRISRTANGVYLVDRLVSESCEEGGYGWESEYEVCLCDACLQPIPGTGKHEKAEGPAFEADLSIAEKWVRDWPIRDYTEYIARVKDMPQMMPALFNITMYYLERGLPLSDYVSTFLDSAVPLYKRIACGVDKEAYAESYRHEIAMLHELSAACDAYQRGCDGIHERIVAAYERYMATELDMNRRKFSI